MESEQRWLAEALQGQGKYAELDWVREGTEGTWSALQRRIQDDDRIDVLHFIGHGKPGKLQLFVDDKGKPDWVDASELADLLRKARKPIPLVVLNACLSGRAVFGEPFSGTASTLVGECASAVVAMQYVVDDDAAMRFSRTFYALWPPGWLSTKP